MWLTITAAACATEQNPTLGSEAEAYLLKAAELEQSGDSRTNRRIKNEVIGPLSRLAGEYEHAQRYEEAIEIYKRLYELEKKHVGDDNRRAGRYLKNLSRLYLVTNRQIELVFINQKLLDIEEQQYGKDNPQLLKSMDRLAFAYKTYKAYSKAENLYKRIDQIYKQNNLTGQHEYARVLYDFASLYIAMGDMVAAEPLYRQSLILKHGAAADINSTLASDPTYVSTLLFSGRYAEAEMLFRKKLSDLEGRSGENDLQVTTAKANLAGLYRHIGTYDKALEIQQHVDAIYRKSYGDNHPLTAVMMASLAETWMALKQYDKALDLLLKATEILNQQTRQPNQLYVPGHFTRANLALAYTKLNQLEKAEPIYARIFSEVSKEYSAQHPLIAISKLNLAELYLLRDNLNKADDTALQALSIAINKRAPHLLARAYFVLAKIRYKEGRHTEAIFYGKQAINLLQGLRIGLAHTEPSLQKNFIESQQENYEILAGWLIDAGRLLEAEQVLAMLKEEEYFNYIRRSQNSDPRSTKTFHSPIEKQQQEKLEQSSRDLVQSSIKLTELENMDKSLLTEADKKEIQALKSQVMSAEKKFQETLVEIKTGFKFAEDKKLIKQLAGEDYQKLHRNLQPKVTLVHYLPLQDGLRIILRSGNFSSAKKVSISPRELNSQVETQRVLLKNRESTTQLLQKSSNQLYQWLIKPIEAELQQLNTETLVFYKNGTLRYIPLSTLHDGRHYLAEKYAVANYNPVAKSPLDPGKESNWVIAGLGVSKKHKNLPALSMVPDELDNIIKESHADLKGIFNGKIYLDEAFTPAQFNTALSGDYNVGHIATHYKFEPGTETDSYLLMGDGSELNLASIRTADHDFKKIDLLTLSACETAVSDVLSDGREIDGLAAVVQSKGAKSVIATLWPVADCSTGIFMERFYQYRRQGLNKAGAMRQIQMEFITGKIPYMRDYQDGKGCRAKPDQTENKYTHPYYWAPFVLMGDWR